MCMQLGTGSEVMLSPFTWWEGPIGRTEGEALVGVGVPTAQPRLATFHIHRDCERFVLSVCSAVSKTQKLKETIDGFVFFVKTFCL